VRVRSVVGRFLEHSRVFYFLAAGDEKLYLSSADWMGRNMFRRIELAWPINDPALRQRVADIYIEHTVLDLIRLRTLTARLKGEQPGPEASIRKILADEHGQHVMALARDLVGPAGMLTGGDGSGAFVPGTDTKGLGPSKPEGGLLHPGWYDGYMFSQALTIGGGTGEVQRNIVAERVLGLPHEVDVAAGMSWLESQRAAGSRS
jgi:alkylation response protein AidB-like acyl-CoA dehydrogenase